MSDDGSAWNADAVNLRANVEHCWGYGVCVIVFIVDNIFVDQKVERVFVFLLLCFIC